MPPVQKRDYPTVMVTIGEKINDMQLRGIDPAHLEIVLGEQTDQLMLNSTGAIFLLDGSGPGPKPGTLHGAKINNFPVVVDGSTPWLVTVRRKRGLGGPKG